MTAFTPAPWVNDTFIVKSLYKGKIGTYGGIVLCQTGLWDVRAPEEAEANARLIAAAPDLLTAVQAVIEDSESRVLSLDAIELCLSAFDKAMGQ